MSSPPTTTNPRKITKLPVGDLRNDISFMSLRNNQLRVALHAHNDDAEDVLCAQVRASARRASCDSEESRCRGFRRNDPRRIHYGRVIDMLADADGQTLRLVEDFGSAFVFKPELEDHSVLRVEAEDLLHRSEERRVGKEGRSRWSPDQQKKRSAPKRAQEPTQDEPRPDEAPMASPGAA